MSPITKSATANLRRQQRARLSSGAKPAPTAQQVRNVVSGNICRCKRVTSASLKQFSMRRGTSGKRHDSVYRRADCKARGHRLLTGTGRYVDDVHLDGMLHAAVFRSAWPHGRLRRIESLRPLQCPASSAFSPIPTSVHP